MNTKKNITLITGYSGSGKTAALRFLEEAGYYCMDNMPAELISSFLKIAERNKKIKKFAIVVDARGKDFMKTLESDLEELERKYRLKIVFFDSSLETVTRRFKESRLKHPLALDGTIKSGYEREQKLLSSLRQHAHMIIDTSAINIHTLKLLIHKKLVKGGRKKFTVNLLSFGFKHGLPEEADLIFDVRFLPNPYFEAKLKKKTGKEASVKNFVFATPKSLSFLNRTRHYIDYIAQEFALSGKDDLTVGVGCTGGKHRSVATVERLRKMLVHKSTVIHRDVTIG